MLSFDFFLFRIFLSSPPLAIFSRFEVGLGYLWPPVEGAVATVVKTMEPGRAEASARMHFPKRKTGKENRV